MSLTDPNAPVLALSIGDPDGIGPEIAFKSWQALRHSNLRFCAFCDPELIEPLAHALKLPFQVINEIDEARSAFADALPVMSLPIAPSRAAAAIASIQAATEACLRGDAAAIVTCPISKARLWDVGFKFPGHTEFIADLTAHAPFSGPRGPVMMLSGGGLRTTLATIHTSLRNAISSLSTDQIIAVGRVTADALKRDFAIPEPRLAVAGLNPHAGEGGTMGTEDLEIIKPAVEALRAEGINAFGPLPADTMFHAEARQAYDAALCMYHDQGLIPVKTLDFHGGVNTTLGLPVIRTSPDHGTAFDIAGQGIARADSLIAALELANTLVANRAAHTS